MTLHDELAQHYTNAAARLQANRAVTLRESGLPSGLAYLCLPLLEHLRQHPDPGEVSDLLGDLVGKQQRLALLAALNDPTAALRSLTDGTPLYAACQALIGALSNPTIHAGDLRTMMQITTGAQSTVLNPTINAPAGDLYLHQAPPNEAELQRIRAVETYLQRIMTECNALPLDLLDASDGASQPMQLGQVYINLFIERQIELTPDELAALAEGERRNRERPTRPVAAWEALGGRVGVRTAGTPVRLMLLGKPGGGKSTFVSHLAFNLAQVELARIRQTSRATSELPGWQLGACIPIRVILRDLAAYQPLANATPGTFHLLISFLKELLTAAGCVEALGALQDALANGRALLFFDGLDEVIGDVLPRVT